MDKLISFSAIKPTGVTHIGVVTNTLGPIQSTYNKLINYPRVIDELLKTNAGKAREIASKKIALLIQHCGLG